MLYLQILAPGRSSWSERQRSLKVTVRQFIHDFLLAFHTNCNPVFYRLRDIARFRSKIAKFPTSYVFGTSFEGDPLEILSKIFGRLLRPIMPMLPCPLLNICWRIQSNFDTVSACDGKAAGHSIFCTMHMRRAVKTTVLQTTKLRILQHAIRITFKCISASNCYQCAYI